MQSCELYFRTPGICFDSLGNLSVPVTKSFTFACYFRTIQAIMEIRHAVLSMWNTGDT